MTIDPNATTRIFYWTGAAGSSVLAIVLFVFNLARIRTKSKVTLAQAFRLELGSTNKLASVKTMLLGLAVLLLLMPVGYGLSRGFEKAMDSLAFAAPCLAGIVVGLALLKTEKKSVYPGMAITPAIFMSSLVNLGVSEGSGEEMVSVPMTSHRILAAAPARKRVKNRKNPERFYYLISTFFLFVAYIGYTASHYNDAFLIFIILSSGWFCLIWAVSIWIGRARRQEKEAAQNRVVEPTNELGAIILSVILGSLVALLSFAAHSRWSELRADHTKCACQK